MFNRLSYWSGVILLLILVFTNACGIFQSRQDDATDLSDNVPAESLPAIDATALPTEPPVPPTPPEPTSTVPAEVEDSEAEAQAQVDDPAATETVLVFSVIGGVAGLCDELEIKRNGDYLLTICGQDIVSGSLAQPDLDSLEVWIDNLVSFQLDLEDNPGGPDNMATGLAFEGRGELEADELQQQVILDWVSGLAVRLRPKPNVEPPTPVPVAVGPDGLCPDVGRPALLAVKYDNPSILTLIDPVASITCDIFLNQPPVGRIATSAGSIYFPVFDLQAKQTTVWQLDPGGNQTPLEFTSLPAEEPGPYDFIVSEDGSKIAWVQTLVALESAPPIYRNELWVADTDGKNQVTILDQVENSELRFVVPVRFSPDGSELYYALQPDIGGPVFSGRYDTLYRVVSSGGEAQEIFGCAEDNLVCIGGLSIDGTTMTVFQPLEGLVQVLRADGTLISSLALPATDYIERTSFGPSGDFAFITAALSQRDEDAPPLPSPGYISLDAPPYTDEPRLLQSDNRIGTLQGWLGDRHLAFGTIDQEGYAGTSVVSADGQVTEVTPDIAVGVLR
jgi:hypothetical protein